MWRFFMIVRIAFFTLLLLGVNVALSAQEHSDTAKAPILLEIRGHYGKIAPHHTEMRPYTEKPFGIYEISLLKNTIGLREWEQVNRYPSYGLSFLYANLNHPVLGSLYSLYPFLDFPIKRWGEFNKISFRMGLGLAYLTNPFDKVKNLENFIYGTHLNALFRVEFRGEFKIAPYTNFFSTLSFTHSSNGVIKEPNLGMNIPSVSAGLSFNLNKSKGKLISKPLPKKYKYPYKLVCDIYVATKQVSIPNSPDFFTGNLSFNLIKQYRPNLSWGAGLDFDWDDSDIERLIRRGLYEEPAFLYTKVGIKAIHQLHLSKLVMGGQFGGYILRKDKIGKPCYIILTLGYDITDWLYLGITLKTHRAFADYLGIGARVKLATFK